MRIWLLSIGEPLPCDGKEDRLWRTGLLAKALVHQGHQVCWWTSTFHHKEKWHRASQDESWAFHPRCTIQMLHARSYRRNVSWGRFVNHRDLARKFCQKVERGAVPNMVADLTCRSFWTSGICGLTFSLIGFLECSGSLPANCYPPFFARLSKRAQRPQP